MKNNGFWGSCPFPRVPEIKKMKTLFVVIMLLTFAPKALASAAFVQINQVEMTQELKDKKLAGKIRSTIAFERVLSDVKVDVEVSQNTVIFSGSVNSSKEKALLIEIVRQTAGEDVAVSIARLSLSISKNKI